MLSTLSVVLPVFGLVLAGWMARRLGVLGEAATVELNRFVVYLALPALLFDIVASADWSAVWRPGFVAAFTIGVAAVFCAAVAAGLARGRPLADAAIDGLNAGYGNTGYLGIPLALVALGPGSQAPTLLASIITLCAVFAVAVVLIEVGRQPDARPGRLALKVVGSLLKNPMILAPSAGALIPLFRLNLPAPAESFLNLLGGAASPCALVALGLFLGGAAGWRREHLKPAALLVGLKLVVAPGLVWVLAVTVFRLPPLLAHTAILMAALPTGSGPFMLAEHYRREAGLTAMVILASTVLSVVTLTAYLAAVR